MRIDPALRALRYEDALQRGAQARLEQVREAWRARRDVAGVLSGLSDYGDWDDMADHPELARIVGDRAAALAFLAPLFDGMTAALSCDPLGQVPFRHQYSVGISVMLLAEAGRATLSLVTYDGHHAGQPNPAQSVCFSHGERHECCIAGRGEGRVFTRSNETAHGVQLVAEEVRFEPGTCMAVAGPRQAKLVDRVEGRLVVLRLLRTAAVPGPSEEYRLADGRLLHRAGGGRREAQEEMMVALLGRMERSDAVPALSAIARSGSDHLRWQALRNCLALDPAAGMTMLEEIAERADDALARPAATLGARLRDTHPHLAPGRSEPCHA